MAVVGSPRDAVLVAPLVDAPLLDSDNPRLAVKELGGTSRTHEAIAAVRPFRIDVCSSVCTDGEPDAVIVGTVSYTPSGKDWERMEIGGLSGHWARLRKELATGELNCKTDGTGRHRGTAEGEEVVVASPIVQLTAPITLSAPALPAGVQQKAQACHVPVSEFA